MSNIFIGLKSEIRRGGGGGVCVPLDGIVRGRRASHYPQGNIFLARFVQRNVERKASEKNAFFNVFFCHFPPIGRHIWVASDHQRTTGKRARKRTSFFVYFFSQISLKKYCFAGSVVVKATFPPLTRQNCGLCYLQSRRLLIR